MRSLVVSGSVGRRSGDGGDVTPGQCLRPVPALDVRGWVLPAGCGAQGKPKGARSVRGATGEGKAGGANASEPLLMPRKQIHPGTDAVPG